MKGDSMADARGRDDTFREPDKRDQAAIAPMMAPDDEHIDDRDVSEPQPYTMARGTCPRCGSEGVIHITFGLPASPHVHDLYPDWVRTAGCDVPAFTRICSECHFEWNVDRQTQSMVLESEARRYELAQATSDQELGSWIDSHLEITTWVERCPEAGGELVVRAGARGTPITDFPLTLAEFWDMVADLERDVIEEWESQSLDDDDESTPESQ